MSWRDPTTKPALEVADTPLSGAPGVTITGEVDMATASVLEQAIDHAIRTSTGAFVIDLTEVTFMDSSGVNVLLRARALLGREDRDVVLVCPAGGVLHVLEVIGLIDLFVVFASRAAAARHLIPG